MYHFFIHPVHVILTVTFFIKQKCIGFSFFFPVSLKKKCRWVTFLQNLQYIHIWVSAHLMVHWPLIFQVNFTTTLSYMTYRLTTRWHQVIPWWSVTLLCMYHTMGGASSIHPHHVNNLNNTLSFFFTISPELSQVIYPLSHLLWSHYTQSQPDVSSDNIQLELHFFDKRAAFISSECSVVLKGTNLPVVQYIQGVPKVMPPSLTRYILRYENSITIKEVCLDRETLHNFCGTKHDPHGWPLYLFIRIKMQKHNWGIRLYFYRRLEILGHFVN